MSEIRKNACYFSQLGTYGCSNVPKITSFITCSKFMLYEVLFLLYISYLCYMFFSYINHIFICITVWKVSKYGVISGPYFPVFGLNTEIYEVNLRIQSKYRKIRPRNNSVFGHFSRSVCCMFFVFDKSSYFHIIWF